MHEIFYKDDFRLIVAFNKPIDAGVDFRGALYTPQTLATDRARFSRRGQVLTACSLSDDGSQLAVAVDGNRLAPGPLVLEMVYLVPSQEMPDGFRTVARRYSVDAVITSASSAHCCDSDDCACSPEPVRLDVEIPWQYVHDTDVYNEVLERVNGTFAAILGTDDVKPAPAPTPSAGTRAVSRPMLRRGLLNLRNQTGDVYRVPETISDGQSCILVKVMLKYGEELDISQWVDTDSIVDVDIPHIAFFELNESSLERDGSVVRLVGPKYKDARGLEINRLPVRIRIKWGSEQFTGFIKMKNGRIVDVPVDEACDPGIYLPKVTKAEAIAYFKRRSGEIRTDGKTIINGRTVEVQRRVRGTKHHYDAEEGRCVKTSNTKWRRWIKRGTSAAHIVRMRYKSRKGYTGAWSYFSHLWMDAQKTHLVSEL